jgi:hypothetical protein
MAFVEYHMAGCKQQVRELLRKRLKIKGRILYHTKKIELHKGSIETLKTEELPKVEKQLDFYLERAGS